MENQDDKTNQESILADIARGGVMESPVEQVVDDVEKDEAQKDALSVIAKLYVAIQREGWEPGPTISEAIGAAHDWYHRYFGNVGEMASDNLYDLGVKESEQ